MKHSVKGAAVPVLIVVLAVGAVCAAGGFIGGVIYASRNKGAGDGEAPETESMTNTIQETAEIPEETMTEETTEPLTEPFTNQRDSVDIIVSGNTYLYQGEEFDLSGILAILRINPELSANITDDNASLKAYNYLIDALAEQGIHYYEESE